MRKNTFEILESEYTLHSDPMGQGEESPHFFDRRIRGVGRFFFLVMRKIMLDRREGLFVESRCQSIMADSHKGVYHG